MPNLTLSFVVRMVAKEDTGDEVATFLADALALANDEPDTLLWFAVRTDATSFWIFDAFETPEGRDAHLHGHIAEQLFANAERLFAEPPQIFPSDILAAKLY